MKHPSQSRHAGFTLIELMVVVVIASILATLAIPTFSRSIHKTKATEFATILTTIYAAEKTARDEAGSFVPIEELDIDEESYSNSKYFEYSVESNDWTNEFTAVATVKAPGIGKAAAGTRATIDQSGTRSGDQELMRYVKTWR